MNNELQDAQDAESAFSNGKTVEARLAEAESGIRSTKTDIIVIKENCQNHKQTTQKVFDELLLLKADFKAMKATVGEITIVKSVVESINLILSKRNSILPNGAKTGIKDVNWLSIMKYIALLIGMAASAYLGGGQVPPVQ